MDHLGLSIDEEFRPKYYRPNLFKPSQHKFHSFPKAAGYKFSDERELQPITPGEVKDFQQFLQSWLFFGLFATVVQLPENESFFDGDFLSEDGGQINTVKLTGFLERWQKQEVGRKDGQTIRMIRTQVALNLAREVVRNHCSIDGKFYRKGRIDEELSLSLMVLGETLTNAKSKIVEKVGFNIRGWHGDATEGWGNSACLLSKMEDEGWCPRTVHMLKGQLKSLATSMLSAYKSHDSGILRRPSHDSCDATEPCKAKSVNDQGVYVTRHHIRCPNQETCPSLEPCKEEILAEIEKDNFPLLCYRSEQDNTMSLDVVPYEPHEKYATISHVWADGYGNPSHNKLWKCQLDFFRTLFDELPGKPADQRHMLFWIDTLAIPVGKSQREKDLRKRAIRKIHEIYTKARYTIVIDNGLTQMAPSITYEGTAMKILASGWMRRLWTLQEAYLSKRLLFAFKNQQLKNLDELEEMYPKASDNLTSNIPTAARNYFHNMLGPDRSARINELTTASGYGLLASVWRAAQWRTTSHKEHETLALATLLNVEYDDSISKAGLPPDTEDAPSTELMKAKKSQLDLDNMMKDLWKLINETCPGSIPSGIVFMPGERLCLKGYGWAPRTWMSGQEIDYPDPLSIMTSAAVLTERGLNVVYPGFLLHTKTQSAVLRANEEEFHFAIDSNLLEWYSVNWKIEPIRNSPVGVCQEEKQLAIILCRPRPRELPEIALLVEIEKNIKQRNLIDQRQSNIYHVYIVCRVKIKREVKEKLLSRWKDDITQSITHSDPEEGKVIFGEVLDENQRWYVDGRPDSKFMPEGIDRQGESPTDRKEKLTPTATRRGTRRLPIPQKGTTRLSDAAASTTGPSPDASKMNSRGGANGYHGLNKAGKRFGTPRKSNTVPFDGTPSSSGALR